MGRISRGVRGLRTDGQVISMLLPELRATVLTVTERGFGKRTPFEEFPLRHRGGMGVIAGRTGKRNGKLVGAVIVQEKDDIFLINHQGLLIRTAAGEVPLHSRNTWGVRMMRLKPDERLVGVVRVADLEEHLGGAAPAADDAAREAGEAGSSPETRPENPDGGAR